MSNGSFLERFTQIEGIHLAGHSYLTPADECYCLGEYTPGEGPKHSDTNQLVLNFKKSPNRRDKPDWPYKERAIRTVARRLETLSSAFRRDAVFVPVPPSKAKDDPLYDDRLLRMLHAVSPALDVRALLVQPESSDAVHSQESGHRDSPNAIADRYYVEEALLFPAPKTIAIVDDVLTTGAHFRAAITVLRNYFPQTTMVGLFIARVPRLRQP